MNQEMLHLHAFNSFCKQNEIAYEVNMQNELISLAINGADYDVYNLEPETIRMGTPVATTYVEAWFRDTKAE